MDVDRHDGPRLGGGVGAALGGWLGRVAARPRRLSSGRRLGALGRGDGPARIGERQGGIACGRIASSSGCRAARRTSRPSSLKSGADIR